MKLLAVLLATCATGCGILIGSHDETPSETTSIDAGAGDAARPACGHTLCEDFTTDPKSGWTVDTAGLMGYSINPGANGFTLLVVLPSGSSGRYVLRKQVPADGKRKLVLDWDMRLDTAAAGISFDVMSLSSDGGALVAVRQLAADSLLHLVGRADTSGATTDVGSMPLDTGKWDHYRLEVVFDAGAGSATLTRGADALAKAGFATATATPVTFSVNLGVDMFDVSPGGGNVDYGNVVFDLQ